MKKAVALICGGEGFEHEISLVGAQNLENKIDRSKFDLTVVFISNAGEWFIDQKEKRIPTFPVFINGESGLLMNDGIKRIDVAVPLLHGNLGEDGVISGLLRAAHIKFVGCDVAAGAVCADKIITKMIADALKIPTAKWLYSTESDPALAITAAENELGYPMFIKPSTLGSSIGISKVCSREEFFSAYKIARSLCERILIEEAVSVKAELECAYLGADGEDRFKTGTILSSGEFYDFDRKYLAGTRTATHCPDEKAETTLLEFSRRLKRALGIRQISRFDFFLTDSGEVIFNEINTLPGMTKSSLYPALTVAMGLSDGEFINRLISEALL